ncbi:MAG: glycosyltransferase, partial [Pseudonocardia sp.]|nr:glycosyltransferase [Pseudonocardia sp.]
MSTGVALVVLAKAPVQGTVKTRLCPPATPEQAAELAAAALLDTLAAAAAVPRAQLVVALAGALADAARAADVATALAGHRVVE